MREGERQREREGEGGRAASPIARTGEILLMTARATETAGLMWAPDTGRKIVLRVIMARPELSPQ